MRVFILVSMSVLLVACGKFESENSGRSPANSTDIPVPPPVPVPTPQPGPNPRAEGCTTITPTAQDSQALAQIGQMSRTQCQQNFQMLVTFYQATQNMTEAQRQAYFAQMTAGISPPPPPPPPVCSVPYEALKNCAEGN